MGSNRSNADGHDLPLGGGRTLLAPGVFERASRVKFKNPASIVAKLIAAGMLIGALGSHQYDYYTLLRWVVCGVLAFAAFQAAKSDRGGWAWALATVALAFNPVIPVHLKRNTWAGIDLAVAVLLLVSIATIDRHAPRP